MKIYTGTTNDILRKKSVKVPTVTKAIKKLVRDMEKTLLETGNGVGLAAPQVGVHLRVVLITLFAGPDDEEGKILPMINPEITKYSMDTVVMEEGCLSIPDYYHKIERPAKVEVRYMDLKGNIQTIALDGLNAREALHEIDHLDGVLFTDYLDKDVILRIPEMKEVQAE